MGFTLYMTVLCVVTFAKTQPTNTSENVQLHDDHVRYFMTLSNPPNCSYFEFGRLMNDKEQFYNRLVIPRLNSSKPLTIKIGFNLIAFRDFDEVSEKFSVVGSLDIIWKDELLTWDTSDYGGLQTIIVHKDMFWTPLLVLVNAYEEYSMVGEESYWPVRYTHTGMALYFPGSVFTSTCLADVSNYPWDNHVCTLSFSAYGYTAFEIRLEPLHDKTIMTYFMGHGEWEIIDSRVETTYHDLVVMFRFEFKRKPLFVLVNIIIPIVFISLLNSLVFLVPVNAGERVSYSITVLLALAVFLTLVSENMPKSGKTIAVLSYYLLSLLSLSMLIMLGTIISLTIHQRTPDVPINPTWKLFAKMVVNRTKSPEGRRLSNISTSDVDHGMTSDEDGVLSTKNTMACRNQSPMSRLCDCKDRRVFEPIIDHTAEDLTWTEIGGLLDTVLFVIAIILLGFFTAMYFVYTLTR